MIYSAQLHSNMNLVKDIQTRTLFCQTANLVPQDCRATFITKFTHHFQHHYPHYRHPGIFCIDQINVFTRKTTSIITIMNINLVVLPCFSDYLE